MKTAKTKLIKKTLKTATKIVNKHLREFDAIELVVCDNYPARITGAVETVRPLNVKAVERVRASWDANPRAMRVLISPELHARPEAEQLRRRAAVIRTLAS